MLDFGWTELLLIAVVALIVIGPKDLPLMFNALGRITARARGMAREFSSAMEDAAKSAGIDDVQKSIKDMGSAMNSPRSAGVDALTRAADRFEKWDPKLPSARTELQPDPAAAPPVDPGMTSSPAPTSSAVAAASATPAPAATEAGTGPAPAADPGSRRLHAVRRSDLN